MLMIDILTAIVVGLPLLAAISTLFVRKRWIVPLRIIQVCFLPVALVLFGNLFTEEITPGFLEEQLFMSMFAFAFMGSPLIAVAVRQREIPWQTHPCFVWGSVISLLTLSVALTSYFLALNRGWYIVASEHKIPLLWFPLFMMFLSILAAVFSGRGREMLRNIRWFLLHYVLGFVFYLMTSDMTLKEIIEMVKNYSLYTLGLVAGPMSTAGAPSRTGRVSCPEFNPFGWIFATICFAGFVMGLIILKKM